MSYYDIGFEVTLGIFAAIYFIIGVIAISVLFLIIFTGIGIGVSDWHERRKR